MSAPTPHPHQPYGQPPAPQPHAGQPHAGQPYTGQPAYGPPPGSGPRPPAGPSGPRRRSPLHSLLSVGIVLAVFGGVAWYVWDYNTSPTGGKAKAEATRSAQAAEAKTHDPNIGDCVKIADPEGDPQPTIVDCASPEAEYKTANRLIGPDKHCGKEFDYGIRYSSRRSTDFTLCFTKVRR